LISRLPYEKWERGGKKDLRTRADEKLRHILGSDNSKLSEKNIMTETMKIIRSIN
jgi:trimethylamine:corrinoid methyltransferase-like protein